MDAHDTHLMLIHHIYINLPYTNHTHVTHIHIQGQAVPTSFIVLLVICHITQWSTSHSWLFMLMGTDCLQTIRCWDIGFPL